MTKNSWTVEERVVAIAVVVFLLGSLLHAVWNVSSLNTKEAVTAELRNLKHSADVSRDIQEGCDVASLPIMKECVFRRILNDAENQRAELDLIAQNATARWTFWMLVTSLGSTAISFAGLYFLAANLLEMRKQRTLSQQSADAAVEAVRVAHEGLATDRAWMTFSECHVREIHEGSYLGAPVDYFGVWLKWSNNGRSPALKCMASVQSFVFPVENLNRVQGLLPRFDAEISLSGTQGVIGPGNWMISNEQYFTAAQAEDVRAGRSVWIVYGKAIYQHMFDSKMRFTETTIKIQLPGLGVNPDGQLGTRIDIGFTGPQNDAT